MSTDGRRSPGDSRRVVARLSAEFAIIFIGVVLAFQFEDWRDRRNDRVREGEQLAALLSDFTINRDLLNQTMEAQGWVRDALGLWLPAVSGVPREVSLDSLGRAYPWAISWYGEETVSGAWDALLGSGDAGLISNPDVRRRLAEFYGIVNSGFEDHDNEMDLLYGLQQLTREQQGALLFSGTLRGLAPQRTEFDSLLVLEMLEFPGHSGLLGWKAVLADNRYTRLQWLAASADTISTILEAELEARFGGS